MEDNDEIDVLDTLAQNMLHVLAPLRRASRLRERNNAEWMIDNVPDFDYEKTLLAAPVADNNDDADFDSPSDHDVFSKLQELLV
ncbi:unnamed protein product [Didymodactylos carnosus]|uniref:Uncharacterized protein n=1 Tax=Didymodactylos carnosus TaxID=1234261 RepID=A0A814P4M6_9BILA|nr:unnamed protein product [Didymodactylos carnosus]CAF1102813.1 unnamed protein product [Didymodactylos carnosus]CAF3566642.1 unnamed protein product [Didymodactylos carnosus]CAF3867592.1 unnamed protein product [Didymodactylos carnosus]